MEKICACLRPGSFVTLEDLLAHKVLHWKLLACQEITTPRGALLGKLVNMVR